ncbi:TPA: lanthionine synthetase [Streptococcus pneumoniae]|nr:lanthionine synthetase [Streptococcus pneumoniae]
MTSSTEFGNFVSNLSFQHGIAGLLFPLNKLYPPELDSKILSIIKKAVTIRTTHTYEYQYSLLSGDAGYLWLLLHLFSISKNQYYLQLANVTAKKLIENYDTLEEIDFALGKSGVLLSLIKYYQFTNDNTLKIFIHNSIGEIYHYFLQRDTAKESILDYSFAHGYCGIAYALFAYSKVLEPSMFYNDLHTFHTELKKLLEKVTSNTENLGNLQLSWCKGISGIILYLCMYDCDGNKDIISKYQEFVFNHHLKMMTGYCHGITSLLQTTVYNQNKLLMKKIQQVILACSERDDHGLLMFQGDSGKADLFDFGIGSMGYIGVY